MRAYLKTLRNEKSLSQENVAQCLGIKQNYYAMIENGERQKDMNLSLAEKLADVFEVPIEFI